MRPLTIEELKALPVGEWIWVVSKEFSKGIYVQIEEQSNPISDTPLIFFRGGTYGVYPIYSTYGTKWVAYKNKEQAEEDKENVLLRL